METPHSQSECPANESARKEAKLWAVRTLTLPAAQMGNELQNTSEESTRMQALSNLPLIWKSKPKDTAR